MMLTVGRRKQLSRAVRIFGMSSKMQLVCWISMPEWNAVAEFRDLGAFVSGFSAAPNIVIVEKTRCLLFRCVPLAYGLLINFLCQHDISVTTVT
jgi:hypothetical protein